MSGEGLPPGWCLASLDELRAPFKGSLTDGPFGSNLKTSHYTEAGPRVIRLQNVGEARFLEGDAHISHEHFERLRKHQALPGDVIIAMLGEGLPRACQVPEDLGDAIVKADCARLRTAPEVSSRYVMYGLNSPPVRTAAAALVHGLGRPRLGLGLLRDLYIPTAPPYEQRRIVEALDSYLSRLDAAQTALERVQANLERYRASVLRAAVEGRLVPTEAQLAREEGRAYEPASALLERILAERRKRWEDAELAKMRAKGKEPKNDKWKSKYKEPSPPDTSKLPESPEGWVWTSMDQLLSHMTSGSRDWSRYYDRGSAVFVMAQNVQPGRLDLSYVQHVDPPDDDPSRARTAVFQDDLLVTIVGAKTGTVCRVPTALDDHYVCQSVALMRPVEMELAPYLEIYLSSPNGRAVYEAFMYGQGRPHLSFSNLRETPVPLPPLFEAARIRIACESLQSIAAAAFGIAEVNASRIMRLRQSILSWAFDGKLVEQDPCDEHASLLLERIQSERESAKPKKRTRTNRSAR